MDKITIVLNMEGTHFGNRIMSWITRLVQQNVSMLIGTITFIIVFQICLFRTTQTLNRRKMMTFQDYLEKGRMKDLFEKYSDLAFDGALYSFQEYTNNTMDNLIPRKHEWIYVSSHSKDKYDNSKLVHLPVKNMDVNYNMSKIKCSENKKHDFSNLLLCNSRIVNPFLVVSTIIHPRKGKKFIFENSINMWSDFNQNDVLPVMFISNLEDFKDNLYILRYACSKGWMVLMTPACNNNGVPIFKDMIQTLVSRFPRAHWHGFVSAEMMFDKTLISTLKFLTAASKYSPISIAVGRRYIIQISQNYKIKSHEQYERLFFNHQPALDDASMTDYFFIQTGTYNLQKIPSFVVGGNAITAWLIHDCITNNEGIIDISESVRAGHQYNTDQKQYLNGDESSATATDYNYDVLKKNNISINLSICFTTCTPLKTVLVEQRKVRPKKRILKHQQDWVIENINGAWSETDTLNKVGDPFYPRLHAIPHDTSIYVEAIATRYSIYEENKVWARKMNLFKRFPFWGIKPDKERFFKICRNHGANIRRQLTYLNIVNKILATEWKLWFKK